MADHVSGAVVATVRVRRADAVWAPLREPLCPSWMRARALSMYLLVLQGGMALGSAVWGELAARKGVAVALAWCALAMVVGLSSILRHRLTADELKMAPAVVRE